MAKSKVLKGLMVNGKWKMIKKEAKGQVIKSPKVIQLPRSKVMKVHRSTMPTGEAPGQMMVNAVPKIKVPSKAVNNKVPKAKVCKAKVHKTTTNGTAPRSKVTNRSGRKRAQGEGPRSKMEFHGILYV